MWLDRLVPTRCAGCAAAGPPLCADCLRSLPCRATAVARDPAPPGLPSTWAVGDYDGVIRSLLLAYKERDIGSLRTPLGQLLAVAVAAVAAVAPRPAQPAALVLVPVPSTAAACRGRGGDVVADLARVAAGRLRGGGWAVSVLPALRHSRPVLDSVGLRAGQRAANLDGALAARPGAGRLLTGAPVVVVDDLVTTGASLAAAARTCRAAGADVLGAAVLAATVRTSGPPRPTSRRAGTSPTVIRIGTSGSSGGASWRSS